MPSLNQWADEVGVILREAEVWGSFLWRHCYYHGDPLPASAVWIPIAQLIHGPPLRSLTVQ